MKQPRNGSGQVNFGPSGGFVARYGCTNCTGALPIFPAKLRCGKGPTGNCVVSYWEWVKLIGTAVLISPRRQQPSHSGGLSGEASVSVGRYLAGLLNEKAARAESPRSNPHPDPDNR